MYTAKDREIYRFPDSDRSADPLELRRRLTIHTQGHLSEWVKLFNDGETDLERAQAEELLVTAARKAFDLKPVDQVGGVVDAVVLEYLAHFLEWLLKPPAKTTNSQRTSRPCTGCP